MNEIGLAGPLEGIHVNLSEAVYAVSVAGDA